MAETGAPTGTSATAERSTGMPDPERPPAAAATTLEDVSDTPTSTDRRSRKRRGRPSRARGQPNSSDAASARWTVRGVPPHIRDMALRGAEARGMTVGDWIAEAIVGFTRGIEKSGATETRPHLPATEAPPDLVAMITRLEERMARLEERQKPGLFGRLFGRLA